MRLGWCDGQPLTASARDDMGEARVGTQKRLSDRTKKVMEDKGAPACRNSLTSKAPYKAQVAQTARPKVPRRWTGADCPVPPASLGLQIEIFQAAANREIDVAFETLAQKQADALLVNPQVLFLSRRIHLVTLAARYLLPAMYWTSRFVEVGGLISYGASTPDQIRQASVYTGRVVHGGKPAELPILRPIKFACDDGSLSASLLGFNGNVGSSSAGSITLRTSWALSGSPASSRRVSEGKRTIFRSACGRSA
jgi:hypothetical protein